MGVPNWTGECVDVWGPVVRTGGRATAGRLVRYLTRLSSVGCYCVLLVARCLSLAQYSSLSVLVASRRFLVTSRSPFGGHTVLLITHIKQRIQANASGLTIVLGADLDSWL